MQYMPISTKLHLNDHEGALAWCYWQCRSRALSALIKHGHTVVAYVRSPAKLAPEQRAVLAGVVTGSVTDKPALKNAILAHNCDAVFHAAGLAQMWGRSKTGEYNTIFATVIAAIVETRQERRGTAIRAWLMSGFLMLDSAIPNLQYLGIIGVQCTEGELVALLLRHKDTLEEAYFSLVDIISGGGSWQAFLATVRDELLVPVLEMNECRSGYEAVYYRDSERDDTVHPDTFEISRTGTQDWTNTINGLVIGDRS